MRPVSAPDSSDVMELFWSGRMGVGAEKQTVRSVWRRCFQIFERREIGEYARGDGRDGIGVHVSGA